MNSDRQRLLHKVLNARRVTEDQADTLDFEATGARSHLDRGLVSASSALSLSGKSPQTGAELKAVSRDFYDNITRQLNASDFGEIALFLNYGYRSTSQAEFSPIRLPRHCLNRNSTKLVLEVIGATDLAERTVLDVGCGRGGTAHVIHRFFKPATFTGLDLSGEAIQFCRETHVYPGFTFVQGDAEALSFGEVKFDVVINIESSHNYPDILAFYQGLNTLLPPGGIFLYADNLPLPLWETSVFELRKLGLVPTHSRDITENVLRSCDENARLHRAAFQQRNDAQTLDFFLAVPGSGIYNEMKAGNSAYRIFTWTKPL